MFRSVERTNDFKNPVTIGILINNKKENKFIKQFFASNFDSLVNLHNPCIFLVLNIFPHSKGHFKGEYPNF